MKNKTQKKQWQAPQIVDLNVKKTKSGTYYLRSETTFPSDISFRFPQVS